MDETPSTSQQTGKTGRARRRQTQQEESRRGGNSEVYLHSVTDMQAALLTESKCQEIKQKTEADVEIDPNQSEVQNTKIVVIRGSSAKIDATVELINQDTGARETISAQAQLFWQQWVEAAFPDLGSRAYFLPPVFFNRVPMIRQSAAGQEVLVLHEAPGQAGQSNPGQSGQSNQPSMNPPAGIKCTQPLNVQDSDLRDDAAMQRFFVCLQKMSEENREVLVGLSQLQFGQYLGEPCYAAAAAHLPVADSLPTALPKNKRGDFDVLLIHRQYGIVVCEVKSFGHNISKLNPSQQDLDKNIRSKLAQAASQLDKAEAMLSHLASDVTPGLRITKTIVFPNLTARQVQQAISGDTKLMQDLCRCLGTTDPADITGLCVCSDQLSDPRTPREVSSDVLRELGIWWQRRVTVSGPDSQMTCDSYKTLVARFCGPATTVTVPCISPPRLCVKTLGQAVSLTGECYAAQITLFPEQIDLLNSPHLRVFLSGLPGTGKTVVLLLKATEWLRCGNDVYIVSTWWGSHAVCITLYHLLLEIVKTKLTSVVSPGQPLLLQYDFEERREGDVEKAVNHLSLAGKSGSLCAIADEVKLRNSLTFFEKLLAQIPRLHLWAGSIYYEEALADWHVEYLDRPLRFPPAVLREVKESKDVFHGLEIFVQYNERGVADHTDGPPVRRLYHGGQGHSGDRPHDCVTCGRDVASFLHSLRVVVNSTTFATPNTINSCTPPCLQWRDVFVLSRNYVSDQLGVVTGLREADIPVRVMKDEDIDDVAMARSDVVWVASVRHVQGLERKIVVSLEPKEISDRHGRIVQFDLMSRCTSQLVIVSSTDHESPEHESHI